MIRRGWVSNSSSSSFVIGLRGDKDLKEALEKEFGVAGTKGVLRDMANAVVESFVRNTEETFETSQGLITHLTRFGHADFTEYDMKLIKLLEEGFVLYTGSISDEWDSWDRSVDMWLCYTAINVDKDDIYIESEGGY